MVSTGRLRKVVGSPSVDGSGGDKFHTLNTAPGQPYPNRGFLSKFSLAVRMTLGLMEGGEVAARRPILQRFAYASLDWRFGSS